MPIKAVFKFRQIAWQMLGPDRMVGAVQGGLDIAQHGVDPAKGG